MRVGTSDGATQRPLAPAIPSPVSLVRQGGAPQMAALLSDLIVNATPSTSPSPFELAGTLALFELGTGTPIFSGEVFGRGTATFQFVTAPNGASIVSGATYDFNGDAPVPEPATLVLVGAGLAGVAARRRAPRR